MIPAPISRINAAEPYTSTAAESGNGKSESFTDSLKLIKAEELLSSTGQYGKLKKLCQNNDAASVKAVEAVIKRHEILKQAERGESVDWNSFDQITDDLGKKGITLFNSSQLKDKKSYRYPTKSTVKTEEGVKEPASVSLPSQLSVTSTTTASRLAGLAAYGKAGSAQEPVFTPSEDNLMVISATYDNNTINNGIIGYGEGKHLFLPLGDISNMLDFNINVDNEQGKAAGWFISEDRKFSLDLKKMESEVDGKKARIPPDKVTTYDGTILVDSDLLSRWFPVDFSPNLSDQSIEILPREKLPFQARLDREHKWKKADTSLSDRTELPRKEVIYNLFEPPSVDLGVAASYNSKGGKKEESSYYLMSKGDLGKMTTEVYLSGDDSDLLKASRFSVERNDPDAGLLGGLKATKIAAGDIRTPEFPLIGGGETERGVTISNLDLNQPVEFDTTHFEGNLPPGWDVEVYRNKMLVGSQRVGSSGRYSLEDIPVYYGKNDFELVFYGPQGQKQVEKKQINIGNQMAKKGEKRYQLSMTQKDMDVYDNDDFDGEDDGSLKYVSRFEYGLADNLSLGGGISSQDVEGERHDYMHAGLKSNLQGAFVSGDWVHDLKGGDAFGALVQTGIGPLDFRLKQSFFNNFTDDHDTAATDPLKSVTGISTSGKIDGNRILPSIPFTLNYNQTEREGSSEKTLGAHFATNLNRTNLNSYTQWRDYEGDISDESKVEGYLQASSYPGKYRIRGRMDYELEPDIRIKSAEISNQFDLNDKLNTEIALRTDRENDTDLEGSLKLNWNNGRYTLSPQLTYDSNNEFEAMMTLSTSLGIKPRSNSVYASSENLSDTGSVSARIFHDLNNNRIFDDGDEPIKGATVKAVQDYREGVTDENGVAFISSLPKYKPTDIAVDKSTLEDPFWEPSGKGESVVPRPGHSELVEIPVVTTGEVDGSVFADTKEGKKRPLSNIPVQLVDTSGKVIKETRSEYDGFYLLDKIPPGEYSVRIDRESTEKMGKTDSETFKIAVSGDGNVESGRNFILKEKDSMVAVSDTDQKAAERQKAAAQSDQVNGAESVKTKKTLQEPRYGLHLTSYKSYSKALEGINVLKKNYRAVLGNSDFSVRKVDLGADRGIYYRLFAGPDTLENTRQLEHEMKKKVEYCRVMKLNSVEDQDSSPRPSQQGRAPVVHIDNNSRKVTDNADSISHQASAENSRAIGIHLASYKSSRMAERGLHILQKQLGATLGNREMFVRRVDLGSKGIWFRLAVGRFDDKKEAAALQNSIRNQGQYAQMMKFSY